MSYQTLTPIQSQIESNATDGFGYYNYVNDLSRNQEIEMQMKLGAMETAKGKLPVSEYENFCFMTGLTAGRMNQMGIPLDTIKDIDDLRKAVDDTAVFLNMMESN